MTTGSIGENDHSYDFGLIPTPPCYNLGDVTGVARQDSGTPMAADDTFTVTMSVTGGGTVGIGPEWTASPAPAEGNPQPYGTIVTFGPFPVSGGPATIVITDSATSTCSTTVVVPPPAVLCVMNAVASNKVVDGHGTVTTADDTYTFDVMVTGQYVGSSGWKSDATPSTGAYSTTTSFGPLPRLCGQPRHHLPRC